MNWLGILEVQVVWWGNEVWLFILSHTDTSKALTRWIISASDIVECKFGSARWWLVPIDRLGKVDFWAQVMVCFEIIVYWWHSIFFWLEVESASRLSFSQDSYLVLVDSFCQQTCNSR